MAKIITKKSTQKVDKLTTKKTVSKVSAKAKKTIVKPTAKKTVRKVPTKTKKTKTAKKVVEKATTKRTVVKVLAKRKKTKPKSIATKKTVVKQANNAKTSLRTKTIPPKQITPVRPVIKEVIPRYNGAGLLDWRSDGLFSRNHKKYHGVAIEKHYKGQTFENDFGECYVITDQCEIGITSIDSESVQRKLFADLKVISGISETTEMKLKRDGFNSVISLTKHIRYGYEAKEYINSVMEKNGQKVYKQLSSRFTSSNPLLLLNSHFFDLSELVFIDIETMGLHSCPLFLIGIASINNNQLTIDQILLRNLSEEKSALHFLKEYLNKKQAICSFNGKSFDIPFIRKRMERHELNHNIVHPHFDIKYFSQKAFSDQVSNCRLTTLESKLFQTQRMEDIPSEYVPNFYEAYISTKNIGSIIPIIDHNKQDLISTVNIFMKLHELWS